MAVSSAGLLAPPPFFDVAEKPKNWMGGVLAIAVIVTAELLHHRPCASRRGWAQTGGTLTDAAA